MLRLMLGWYPAHPLHRSHLQSHAKLHDAVAPAPSIPVMLFQARQPCTHKIVIAGNHDQHLQVSTSNNQFPESGALPDDSDLRQEIGVAATTALLPHCAYLCNQTHTAAGLRFFASPYSRGNSPNCAFQGKKLFAPTILIFH